MYIFLLVLLSMYTVFAADQKETDCKKASIHVSDLFSGKSFPIGKYFSRLKLKKDYLGRIVVPTSSKAFIMWRNRTSPWIPNSAFLWEVATHEERLRLAGYPDVHSIESKGRHITVARELTPSSANKVRRFYRHKQSLLEIELRMEIYKDFIKLVKAEYDSIRNFLKANNISIKLKKESLAHPDKNNYFYYFIDESGRVWLFPQGMDRGIFAKMKKDNIIGDFSFAINHSFFYSVFLSGMDKGKYLIDYGVIYIEQSGGVLIVSAREVHKLPQLDTKIFDPQEYILNYFR
jgi:hypothetical protein